MKSIQYFDILKRALLTTWNNKFLWVFGLMIFLGSTTPNMSFDNSDIANQTDQADVIANLAKNHPDFFLNLGIAMLLIAIFLFALKVVASAAIIKSINDVNLYKQLGFKRILVEAKKYFWKLVALELIIVLLLVAIVTVLAVPIIYLFAIKANILAILLSIVAFAIVFPLLILTVYLRKYAYYFLVLSNAEVKTALESAYLLFERNFLPSLLMGVITLAFSFGLVMAALILFLTVAIIFAPFGLLAYWLFAKTGAAVVLAIAAVLTIIVLLGIISWYEAFLQTAWLYFFQQIAFRKSKTEEVQEKIKVEGEIPTPEAVLITEMGV